MSTPPAEPTVVYQDDGPLQLVRCGPGTADAAWLIRLFRKVGALLATANAVLIDVREVEMRLTTSERYRVGEAAAAYLAGPPVATVGRADLIDPEKFGEMVARNRGVDGRIFTDLDEARAWLARRLEERRRT